MEVARPDKFVYEFLKNGESIEMNVDGTTPVTFRWTCPGSGSFELVRINVVITDGSIGWGEFAGVSALTNGLKLEVFNSSDVLLKSFTAEATIKTNEDWGALAGTDAEPANSAGVDGFPVRWTIERAGARMQFYPGDYLKATVQDDLSGITKFRMMVQGILR